MKNNLVFLIFCAVTLQFSVFLRHAHAYQEEEIVFPVGDTLELKGYVSKPDRPGLHPVVVIQLGSGPGTTDHPTRTYNPFAEIARALSDQGFVVLRFDKRGTGYNLTNGSFADGTYMDGVRDLSHAVDFIKLRGDVANDQIFLLGHSLGGPTVADAAKMRSDIKGIILSAAPARSFADFVVEQNRYLLVHGEKLAGAELEDALQPTERAAKLIGDLDQLCAEVPAECTVDHGRNYWAGQGATFWKEIDELDTLATLQSLGCEIFSISGSSDWIVSSEHDAGAIYDALFLNPRFSEKVLSGLDHFFLEVPSKQASVEEFMKASSGAPVAWKMHPDYVPEILGKLQSWIQP